MADGVVVVAPDSTGKKIDNSEIAVGANTVERQRINIADPTSATAIATVTAANALKIDGSAVTQPVSGTFWQATQPVSGTFWQATQPVSIAAGVTANAGTNLNTSLLDLEADGNLAQIVTDSGAPGATACATDTSSCNFNQQFQRIAQRLTTINTTL